MNKCGYDLSKDCNKTDCLNCVLDKIRSELIEQKTERCFDDDDMAIYRTGLEDALCIVDKYKKLSMCLDTAEPVIKEDKATTIIAADTEDKEQEEGEERV